MRVFISYAREDREAARRLFTALRNEDGIHPWMDEEALLPGMEWEWEIMRAIDKSEAILLLFSQTSIVKTGVVQQDNIF